MKLFRFLTLMFLAAVAFLACQKELEFETTNPATGTLARDSMQNCLPINVVGNYVAGTPLNAANYAEVTVNVANPGSYFITTDSLNGMVFKDSGVFNSPGAQLVRLRGYGTPQMQDTTTKLAMYLNSMCTFDVVVRGSGSAASAVYTATCTNATANGTYTAGTAPTAANTITIPVNVTTAGSYSVTTTAVNGMTFSGSGTLATGAQTITLTASGTPTTAGAQNYTIPGTGCTVAVNVTAAGPAATYTLGATAGACTGAATAGTYTAGTAMGAGNTATVNVNVTAVGSYTITTTAVNGVTFSKSGTFTTTGAQTVVLTATGTPTAAGTFRYPLSGGGSTCSFSVNYTGGGGGTTNATYTLGATAGACTGATTAGTYTAGTAMGAGNTATVNVNVTALGNYTITTTAVNGVTFSKTGTFTSLGAQTVVLTASGTPTAAGTFSYPLSGGGSTCSFSVTFAGSGTNPVVRDTVTMMVDGVSYSSVLDTVIIRPQQISGVNLGTFILQAYSSTTAATNDTLRIQLLVLNTNTVVPGSYNVNSFDQDNLAGHILYGEFSPGATPTTWYSNESDPDIPPQNPGFNLVITSVTATRVRGTFNGRLWVQTNSGQGSTYKTITNGFFSVTR